MSRRDHASLNTAPLASPSQAWHSAALVLILILAAALRIYSIEKANLWLDEFWTLELSCGHGTAHEHLPTNVIVRSPPSLTSLANARPVWTIWTTLNDVTHPPLFFLLLRIWREILGPSEMAARLLPCLTSLGAVALMYRVARDLHGPGPALWAALLLALAGQQIYFAQEIRSYSLIVMLGLLACSIVVSIEKRGDTWARIVALAACVFTLVLTHYFTVGGVVAIVAYAALRLSRRTFLRIIGALAVAGVVYLVIWGPFFLQQRNAFALEGGKGGAYFLLDRQPHHFRDMLFRLGTIPGETLSVNALYHNASWVPWFAIPMLLAFLAPLIWIRRQPGLLLWYLWTAGVILPLLLLDLTRESMHLQFPKYTMLGGVGVCGVLGAGFAPLGRWGRHIVPALCVAACAAFAPSAFGLIEEKPDWQPMVTRIAETVRPGDPILCAAETGAGGIVYLYVSHYLAPMDNHPTVILVSPPNALLESELRASGHCWIVYSGHAQILRKLLPNAQVDVQAGVANDPVVFGEVVWKKH